MLRELSTTRQIHGEPRRRWFESSQCDLIVWLRDDDSAEGFQFCYDKDTKEHALTWLDGRGFSHMAVDTGPSVIASGKGTPLLVANGTLDVEHIREIFTREAAAVPPRYVDLVLAKLFELSMKRGES
jgi:hypothetical protein